MIGFPMFKVFKGEEEQFLEEMMMQSLLNVQVEMMKRGLKANAKPIPDYESPPDTNCIGFNITQPKFQFYEGYIHFLFGYEKVNEEHPENCEIFRDKFKDGP